MFGLGCAAGIAATMMLRSKSGQEAMEYLRSQADEKTKSVRDAMGNVRETVGTMRDAVGSMTNTVTDAATQGMKAMKYQAENVQAAIDAGKKAFKNAQEMTP